MKVLASLLLCSSILVRAALVTLVQIPPPDADNEGVSQVTRIYTPIGTAQDGHETTYSFTEVAEFTGGGTAFSFAGSKTITSAWTSIETYTENGIRIEGASGFIVSQSQDDSRNQLSRYLTCSYSGTSGGCREDSEEIDGAGFAANIPGLTTETDATRTTTLTTSWTGTVVPIATITGSGGSSSSTSSPSSSNNGAGQIGYR
ncbi:hypothetical protein DL96DRAFT_1676481, partial [Flagelloscypha sp. PMI_526]